MSRVHQRSACAVAAVLALFATACGSSSTPAGPPAPIVPPANDTLADGGFGEPSVWHLATAGDVTSAAEENPDFTGNCFRVSGSSYGGAPEDTQLVYWNPGSAAPQVLSLDAGRYRLYARVLASGAGRNVQVVVQDGSNRTLGSLAIAAGTRVNNFRSDLFDITGATDVTFRVNLGGAANAGTTFYLDDLYLVREGNYVGPVDGRNLLTGGDFEGTFDRGVWNYYYGPDWQNTDSYVTTSVAPCTGFTGNCFRISSTNWGANAWDTQLAYSSGGSAVYFPLSLTRTYTINLRARASTAGATIQVLLQDAAYGAPAYEMNLTLTDTAENYTSGPFTLPGTLTDTNLAFKINFGPETANAGVTFYLDDLQLLEGSDSSGLVVQNFEADAIGFEYAEMGWTPDDIIAAVADDPVAPGNNVLRVSSTNYNAAPVIALQIPTGSTLGDYGALTFRAYFESGDVGSKTLRAYAYSSPPTGSQAFADDGYLGTFYRAGDVSAGWEDITLDISNTYAWTGTVYFALGFNNSGSVWYADDVTLVHD